MSCLARVPATQLDVEASDSKGTRQGSEIAVGRNGLDAICPGGANMLHENLQSIPLLMANLTQNAPPIAAKVELPTSLMEDIKVP